MLKKIELLGGVVEYDLQRKAVKNINLRIKSDMSIHVSANNRVGEEHIEKFLRSKAEFILKALKKYAELKKHEPKEYGYSDGERFLLFGDEKILKVAEGKPASVTSDETNIILTIKSGATKEQKRRVLTKWLNGLIKETVKSICDRAYRILKNYGMEYPQIKFRNMVSMWGSYAPKTNTLTFNYALVHVPMPCIEYVVMHEFTHFLQPNHSKEFYKQLGLFMPDWKERQSVLKRLRVLR